jgi:succinate dehydrogenase / fumarate reductase, cytochrome b subunit
MTTAAVAVPRDHSFFWRRVHSLSGIVPVGAFLVEHLFSNAYVLRGRDAYNAQVGFLVHMPLVHVLEWVFIFIPILYHAIYGTYVWWRGQSNVAEYPWMGNWLYTAQRYTGLVTFAYIVYHTTTQRFMAPYLMEDPGQAFAKVAQELSHPLVLAAYVVGIGCACFHFAYGLWLFCCKWGITSGARAQRVAGYAFAAFGVALAAAGYATLAAFLGWYPTLPIF